MENHICISLGCITARFSSCILWCDVGRIGVLPHVLPTQTVDDVEEFTDCSESSLWCWTLTSTTIRKVIILWQKSGGFVLNMSSWTSVFVSHRNRTGNNLTGNYFQDGKQFGIYLAGNNSTGNILTGEKVALIHKVPHIYELCALIAMTENWIDRNKTMTGNWNDGFAPH